MRIRNRILQAQSVTGLSQVLGTLQFLLLISSKSFGRPSDVFTLLFLCGQAPLSVAVIGFLYPEALANTDSTNWTRAVWRTAFSSVVAVAAGAAYLMLMGYPQKDVLVIGVLLVPSSAAATAASVYAVSLACRGKALFLAGLAVPANFGACIFLIAFRGAAGITCAAVMCLGLFLGNMVLWRVARREHLRCAISAKNIMKITKIATKSRVWLAVSGVTGYGGALLLAAGASHLPAGRATLLSLITKTGAAVVGVGLNAALSVLINWESPDTGKLRNIALFFARLGLACASLTTLVLVFTTSTNLQYIRQVLCGLIWLILSALALLVNRAVYVSGQNEKLKGPSVASIPLYLAAFLLIIVTQDTVVYLASLALINGLSAVWLSWRLGWRPVLFNASFLVLLTCVGIVSDLQSPLVYIALATAGIGTAIVQNGRTPRMVNLRA